MENEKFRILYQGGTEFILTVEEMNAAKEQWQKGEPYWCERHRASLSRFYMFFESVRQDISERRMLN